MENGVVRRAFPNPLDLFLNTEYAPMRKRLSVVGADPVGFGADWGEFRDPQAECTTYSIDFKQITPSPRQWKTIDTDSAPIA